MLFFLHLGRRSFAFAPVKTSSVFPSIPHLPSLSFHFSHRKQVKGKKRKECVCVTFRYPAPPVSMPGQRAKRSTARVVCPYQGQERRGREGQPIGNCNRACGHYRGGGPKKTQYIFDYDVLYQRSEKAYLRRSVVVKNGGGPHTTPGTRKKKISFRDQESLTQRLRTHVVSFSSSQPLFSLSLSFS